MFYFLLLLLTLNYHLTKTCETFDQITVKFVKVKSEFNKTINGCLNGKELEDGNLISQTLIRQQKLKDLEKGTIRNMDKLRTISFWGCQLKEVAPKAFSNLPSLINLQVAYCNLKEIYRKAFNNIPTVELLRIHNNEIDFIESGSFSNLRKLKRIDLSTNLLEYWNREWFTNSTALEIMDFQGNRIRSLPRKAFANLPKLNQIFFDYNEIESIQEGAFQGITKLSYLGLRYNRLKVIGEEAFPNKIKVRSLLIDANYLNFLPNEVLKKLAVEDLTLDGNPFKCACLDRINYWLYESNGTLRVSEACKGRSIPVCSLPKSFSTTCIEIVDEGVTRVFLDKLRSLEVPLDSFCARLD